MFADKNLLPRPFPRCFLTTRYLCTPCSRRRINGANGSVHLHGCSAYAVQYPRCRRQYHICDVFWRQLLHWGCLCIHVPNAHANAQRHKKPGPVHAQPHRRQHGVLLRQHARLPPRQRGLLALPTSCRRLALLLPDDLRYGLRLRGRGHRALRDGANMDAGRIAHAD